MLQELPLPPKACLARFAWLLHKPRKLPKALEQQQRRLLGLAKLPFDNSDDAHGQALGMLYTSCTAQPCPGRLGRHWEGLGFQGSDPATDLRGAGMLAVLQLLHLFKAHPERAAGIYALSLDATQVCRLFFVRTCCCIYRGTGSYDIVPDKTSTRCAG